MKNYFLILNIVFSLFIISCTHHPIADRIYMNAKIWTGDSSNPSATAIAIKDSTILFVGNDYQSYVGSNTILKDLGGKMLVPGFTDNHTHFLEGGFSLSTINLRQVKQNRILFKRSDTLQIH